MKRAEGIRKIIKDIPGVQFCISATGQIIDGETLLRLYDMLNEDITQTPKKHTAQTPKQEVKRGREKKEYDVPKMVALHKAGWSYQAIADEMGCSPGTACTKVREALGEI